MKCAMWEKTWVTTCPLLSLWFDNGYLEKLFRGASARRLREVNRLGDRGRWDSVQVNFIRATPGLSGMAEIARDMQPPPVTVAAVLARPAVIHVTPAPRSFASPRIHVA